MATTTLIGDLVGSRVSGDRRGVHRRLGSVLDDVNRTFRPDTPLRITVGDEYQGVFASLGAAVTASLVLRLALLPDVDVRHGLGRGAVQVLGEQPRVEDGPGWWAARAAIEQVEQAEERAALRSLRTAYVAAGVMEPSDEESVNAALMLRDQLVTGLSERSLSVLRGLLSGLPQREVAERLQVSPSAVSQRVRSDGLGVIVAAHTLMGGLA